MVITDFNHCIGHHDPTTIGLSMMMIPMRAATPLTKVRVPKAEVSRSTPRISTRAGGVTAHLRRGEISNRDQKIQKKILMLQNNYDSYQQRVHNSTYQAERKKPNMAETRTNDLHGYQFSFRNTPASQVDNGDDVPVWGADGHQGGAGGAQGQGECCHHQWAGDG